MTAATATLPSWTELRINEKQVLLTAADLGRLPAIDSSDPTDAEDLIVQVHFFSADFDFYAVQFDASAGTFYGFLITSRKTKEWGTLPYHDLVLYRNGAGRMHIERDDYWVPRPARAI